jgi:hypothetical protein
MMTLSNSFNYNKLTCNLEKCRYMEGVQLILNVIDSKIKDLRWNKGLIKSESAGDLLYQLNFLQVKRREFREIMGEFKEESVEHWHTLKELLEIEVEAFEREVELKIGDFSGEWVYFISNHKKL